MNRVLLIALLAGVQRFIPIGVNYWFFLDEFGMIASVCVAFVFVISIVIRWLWRGVKPNETMGWFFFLFIILCDSLIPFVLILWTITRWQIGLILTLVVVVSIYLITPYKLFRRPASVLPGEAKF